VNHDVERLVRGLALARHPEGGWFRETWRSPETLPAQALPERFAGPRSLATSILYLLAAGEYSRFHRLNADELWCHQGGGRLHIHRLGPAGAEVVELGPEHPQALVPHGCWFAVEPAPGASWALAGCFVSPGFDFTDLVMASRAELLAAYPEQRELVLRFTPDPEPVP
jgi:predicted cupin superfamily sugar epimerase